MKDWSMYYSTMGGNYVIPSHRCFIVETGQGWHSGSWNRGLMSCLVHFAGRLLMGRQYSPDGGRVRLNLFHISSQGMQILKKCKDFNDGGANVSISFEKFKNCFFPFKYNDYRPIRKSKLA